MDKQILEKVIQKAIEGGWAVFVEYKVTDGLGAWASVIPEKGKDWQSKIVYWQPRESIIFNHEFAKALWGEAVFGTLAELAGDVPPNRLPHWQYHLQQMVIADDPIKYLGENM